MWPPTCSYSTQDGSRNLYLPAEPPSHARKPAQAHRKEPGREPCAPSADVLFRSAGGQLHRKTSFISAPDVYVNGPHAQESCQRDWAAELLERGAVSRVHRQIADALVTVSLFQLILRF